MRVAGSGALELADLIAGNIVAHNSCSVYGQLNMRGSLTISEAANSVHGRHLYDKGKHVIDEGVESLVCEHPPGEVSH